MSQCKDPVSAAMTTATMSARHRIGGCAATGTGGYRHSRDGVTPLEGYLALLPRLRFGEDFAAFRAWTSSFRIGVRSFDGRVTCRNLSVDVRNDIANGSLREYLSHSTLREGQNSQGRVGSRRPRQN